MLNKVQKRKALQILNNYGIDKQATTLNEKMNRLTELIDLFGMVREFTLIKKIEIILADVYVMLEQIKLHFSFEDLDIKENINVKLNSTLEKIKENEKY